MKRMLWVSLLLISFGCVAQQPAQEKKGPYSLAQNNSLEQVGPKNVPVGYDTFKAWGAPPQFGSDDGVSHSGKRSFKIASTRPTQVWIRTDQFPVSPGEEIHASGWVKLQDITGSEAGGTGRITIMAEFTTADGKTEHFKYLSDAKLSPKAIAGRSPTTLYTNSDWQKLEGKVVAPEGTMKMKLRFGMFDTQGTMWWDDLNVDTNSSLSARIELKSPRLEPEAEGIPISILNRAGRTGPMNLIVRIGNEVRGQIINLNGQLIQNVKVAMPIEKQRGEMTSQAVLMDAKLKNVNDDKHAVNVPEALLLYPIIPTHWAKEDGPPKLQGDVDIAVTKQQREDSVLNVVLTNKARDVLASWSSLSTTGVTNGMNSFKLNAPQLPEGEYTVIAQLRQSDGKLIRSEQPLVVISRSASRTVLNKDGYLEAGGKAIFPLGIFNGGGKMKEMGDAGFTVSHAYNDMNVELGERPKDQNAKRFLDESQKNGMKVLFLVPREWVFNRKWDEFRRRVRMFRNHPALLAWDEEEGIARGDMKPDDLATMRKILQEEDPNHPLMVGDSRDQITRVTDRSNFFPLKSMDLGMWWWYPIPPGGLKADLLAGEELVKAQELAPPTFLTQRNTDKPLWVGVQSYKKGDWARYPTPTEYRAQAYISIIHGAKGLMWYAGSVEGGLYLAPEEGHWDYLQKLAKELHEMSPVFMSPTGTAPKFEPASALVSVMRKTRADGDVLLAANRGSTAIDMTFDLPVSAAVPVLYENRSVAPAGGKLKDHFQPYAVHVYHLPKAATQSSTQP